MHGVLWWFGVYIQTGWRTGQIEVPHLSVLSFWAEHPQTTQSFGNCQQGSGPVRSCFLKRLVIFPFAQVFGKEIGLTCVPAGAIAAELLQKVNTAGKNCFVNDSDSTVGPIHVALLDLVSLLFHSLFLVNHFSVQQIP